MKQILFLLLIGLSSNLIFAQDIIVKQNGDEIKSKILEITIETIKYKEFKFQDGPTRNINISEVFMIIYENGEREKFTTTESQTLKEKTKNVAVSIKNNMTGDLGLNNDFKDNYVMLGTGYGNSYGGLGMRLQWRKSLSGDLGLGVHAGMGYLPNTNRNIDPFLSSFGVKFFPYRDLYINLQFGTTGKDVYYNYHYYYDYYFNTYGPSLLIGGDWTWGNKVGCGFNAALGITANMNARYYSNDFALALDLGFIIRF